MPKSTAESLLTAAGFHCRPKSPTRMLEITKGGFGNASSNKVCVVLCHGPPGTFPEKRVNVRAVGL